MPYIKDGNCVVIGTADEPYSVCRKHCEAHEIKTLYIEGADHSLEIKGQPYENMDILKRVMKFVDEFE